VQPLRRRAQHPVPGIAQADRLMDAADRADRLELAQRLAEQKSVGRAMKK
jgi:hypothetical protein